MKKILKIVLILLAVYNSFQAKPQVANTYDTSTTTHVQKQKGTIDKLFEYEISERILTSSIIIGEMAILLFILFYWKKTREDTKLKVSNIYKKNINAIREEKVKPLLNNKHNTLRQSLMKQLRIRAINGRIITNKAKKMSIAKGELLLAARIQQLQNQVK